MIVASFTSWPKFYELEHDGRKPNTVRILSQREYEDAGSAARAVEEAAEYDDPPKPAEIRITNDDTGASFTRRLTDVSLVGELLGKYIVVYSWEASRS